MPTTYKRLLHYRTVFKDLVYYCRQYSIQTQKVMFFYFYFLMSVLDSVYCNFSIYGFPIYSFDMPSIEKFNYSRSTINLEACVTF